MTKYLSVSLLAIVLLFTVAAEIQTLGVFEQNNCVVLKQACANCTYNNITSVLAPNSSNMLIGVKKMTKIGTEYNYSFCSTEALGGYIVTGYGDVDGVNTMWAYDFQVTANGKPTPSGAVIVLFVIAFLIIMGGLVYTLISGLGHLVKLDYDVIDLSKALGLYFGILSLYMLSDFYLGNPDIQSFLLLFIEVGAITHVLVPFVSFILAITVGSLTRKKFDGGTSRIANYRRAKL